MMFSLAVALVLALELTCVSATFPMTRIEFPGFAEIGKRAEQLQAREELSCLTEPASTSQLLECVTSVGNWLEAHDCSAETNTVSMMSCNCHYLTEMYNCFEVGCPNLAGATITDPELVTLQSLAPTCTQFAEAGDLSPTTTSSENSSSLTRTSSSESEEPTFGVLTRSSPSKTNAAPTKSTPVSTPTAAKPNGAPLSAVLGQSFSVAVAAILVVLML